MTDAAYASLCRSWLRDPAAVRASEGRLLMNYAGQGHVDLYEKLSQLLGFPAPARGLEAAQQLLSASVPFVGLTLTNDHQPRTQREHDLTVQWERRISQTRDSDSGPHFRFIGQPGVFVEDGERKTQFCKWSEELAVEHDDPSLRIGVPCAIATNPTDPRAADAYATLLRTSASAATNASELFWMTRALKRRGVVAHGGGIRPIVTHAELMRDNQYTPQALARRGLLLLRYLHPALLQRGDHLGSPVAVRLELRVSGLIQWEPLRVWVSRHGFTRGGSPWANFSVAHGLTAANRPMWDTLTGPDARCATEFPSVRPPWISAERFEECRPRCTKRRPVAAQPAGCCLCTSVADTLDVDHAERGFATGGTLLRLEHAARDAGLSPSEVRASIDSAITRFLTKQQRQFQAEANGSTLSRWHTPFSFDIAFDEKGNAVIYDTHLIPAWKRPKHWGHPAIDRGNNLGVYSAMMLAMSPFLLTPAADAFHAKLIDAIKPRPSASERGLLLEFARDQALAGLLGFRRAFPLSQPDQRLQPLLSKRDLDFARLARRSGLLFQHLEARGQPDAAALKDIFDDRPEVWGMEGELWRAKNDSQLVCDDAKAVLAQWKQ